MTQEAKSAEQIKREIAAKARKPWQKWMKVLLAHIFKSYMPTIDAREAVLRLEAATRGDFEVAFKSDPIQLARFEGHLAALQDGLSAGFQGMNDPEFAKLKPALASKPTYDSIAKALKPLKFQERVIYIREFSHAYGRTFTPLGELCGRTDATSIYVGLLLWSLTWHMFRPPRSVAELQKWWLSRTPRPPLSPLEELRREEREAAELKRLQQICERIGLRFRPPRSKARDSGPKSSLPLTPP